MKLLKQVVKQIAIFYGKSLVATICLIVGAALLLCLYMASGSRLMSDRELEELLSQRYGREFVVLESLKLSQEERAEEAWRAKLFEVAPADEPERRFWAFSVVSSGFGGVPGVSNGLLYTYVEDMLLAAFEQRATAFGSEPGLTYEVKYSRYPFKESAKESSKESSKEAAEYYGDLHVRIENVAPYNLELVCQVLAATIEDVQAQLPEGYDLAIHMNFRLVYRDEAWPAGETCTLDFWPTKPVPEGEGALREYFQAQVDSYVRLFIDK